MLQTGQYLEASALINYLERVSERSYDWLNCLYFKIFRAVAYLKLSEKEQAIKAFREIYDLTYKNGIITPLIEGSGGMRSLIDAVRKSKDVRYDHEWLNNVYAKASGYAKKMSNMRNRYTSKQQKPRMTERRVQVLERLAHGYTIEEVALDMHITEATVRTHRQNI